jgi:hypothetical protein
MRQTELTEALQLRGPYPSPCFSLKSGYNWIQEYCNGGKNYPFALLSKRNIIEL